LTRRIAESGAHVLGVDASPEMVAAARERGIEAENASAEALPFRNETFDAVFSNAVLHWVRNQDAMIQQVHRVLKSGGRFVVEMGGHGNVAAIHVALTGILDRHGFGDRERGVNYYPSARSYSERLQHHGFRVEQMALIPRPTKLGESGMEGWLRTFRRGVLEGLPDDVREDVVRETVDLLAPALRDEAGNWIADYVRLRFVARA
jgi:trans-aconitate methyltransferase